MSGIVPAAAAASRRWRLAPSPRKGQGRDGLARVVERVGWRVHVAPIGYRLGEAIGTAAGWYDDITYEPR